MTDTSAKEDFDPAVLFRAGFTFGCADLIQGGAFRQVIAGMVITLLCRLRNESGDCIFKGITIILPPTLVSKHTEKSVFIDLSKATEKLRGHKLTEQEERALYRMVRVVNSPSLEISDLINTVEEHVLTQFQGILIADACQYRDCSFDLLDNFGISAVRLAEDRWTPNVVSICQQLVSISKAHNCYGLIHVSGIPAKKTLNEELLLSVDDCYVAILSQEEDPEEEFNSRVQLWRSMVLRGLITEVQAELGHLSLSEGVKLHALVQLLQGVGRDKEMLHLIAQLRSHLWELKRDVAIQLAQLAYQAGDDELALEIMPMSPEGIGDQLWLEKGLEMATQLEDCERIESFYARLEALFPYSARLIENRDRRLIMNCQRAKTGDLPLFTTAGFTDCHLELQARLSVFNPEYGAIMEELSAKDSNNIELATVCCALHAQASGESMYAAEISAQLTTSELYGRQATQILIYSIKSMMLNESISKVNSDYYRHFFSVAFKFLAYHPEDNDIRSKLEKLLSVESCGDLGIPIVALTVLDLAKEGTRLAIESSNPDESPVLMQDSDIETSIQNGFSWLAEISAAEPGVTVLPRDLLIANPDSVIITLKRLVDRASGIDGEFTDLEFMKKLVLLACAISPYAKQERNTDIRLVAHLANNFAMQGQFQQARNLAESILLMGHLNPYRYRLAWQAFGDIYHRCRNHTVALIGLANALAIDVEVFKDDVWQETYLLHRVLRDLGLLKLSRSLLPKMKIILSDLGFDVDQSPRLLSAELTLRLIETHDADTESLGRLLAEVTELCRRGIESGDKLDSFVLLMGQTVLKAENSGIEVSSDVRSTLDIALRQINGGMAGMVRAVSIAKPTAKDVLEMFNSLERSWYASDAMYDQAMLEPAARRLLDGSKQTGLNLNECIFATELLAEHTLDLLGETPVMTVDWPAQYAMELNEVGLDVAFFALDTNGELIVSYVSAGEVSNVEQPKLELSFLNRYRTWLLDYPKNYGYVDYTEGNNVFYLTMEKLDVRLPRSDRIVVIAEPFLQQLTMNLVLIYPEDGGYSYFVGGKTAIGIVPSVSWLSSIRTAKRSNKRFYRAWISADLNPIFQEGDALVGPDVFSQDVPEHELTLDIALRRLSGCFEEYGFLVDTGRRLPLDMQDTCLAVVTAHGGLSSDGYLHRILDDQNLVASPSALATALAGVELIILFVCSGGRIDKNPWGNSTTSLPKQLLNKGCRAVIASPWPLDVRVTYNWLGVFMQEWEAGAMILDATKTANDAVARQLGDLPQCYLAMRVYGDVSMCKSAHSVT